MRRCTGCRQKNMWEVLMRKGIEWLKNIGYASKIIFAASKKYFILKMFFSLVSSLLPYLPLFLWQQLLNGLVAYTAGENDVLLSSIWFFTLSYCGVLLLSKLVDALSKFVQYKYNDAIQYYLDNLMVDKMASVDLAFFDSSHLQDKMNNAWMLVDSTQSMVSFVFDMFQKGLRLVISFSLLLSLGWWCIPIVILLSVPSVLGDRKINTLNYRFEKEQALGRRKMEYYKNLFFGEGHQEIVLYSLKDYFLSLYQNVWSHWDRMLRAKDVKTAVIHGVSLLLLALNEGIVYVVSVTKLIAGQMQVGDVTYYVSLLAQFREDFTSLCYRINQFAKNSAELQDVREFIEMKPMVQTDGTRIPGENPEIVFRDVSFRYPEAERPVLEHCSFTIHPGECVGLVGLNGSGKSTIVKLLCRFYDTSDGEILIDGVNIREYRLDKLRALFGTLFQETVAYSFTLRENIALSDLDGIEDAERIGKACIQSGVTDFTADWEKGIDENMTRRFAEDGKELSGGQWQRVALARAFFRNSPVILLDEPSAALDPVAEHRIFEDFKQISKGKSTILISHRLSSIRLADKILVLENGRILEEGGHDALLAKGGRYAYLFGLQASKYV